MNAKAEERGEPHPFPTHRDKCEAFVREYKKTGSIALASKHSGLSNGQGADLVRNHPDLRADISALLAECGVTPTLIATELRRLATFDPRQMLDADGRVRPMQDWPEDLARAVQGMDVGFREFKDESTEVTHKPRFADKLGPLKELARMSAMASDRIEIANPPGQKFSVNNEGSLETRDQVIASLLALVAPKKDPPPAPKSSKKG